MEAPQADFDAASFGFSSKVKASKRIKKNDWDNSQCSSPLIAMSGIAHRYGSCRKYVLRCSPSGLVTRSPFLTDPNVFHSATQAIDVHMVFKLM
jgi:hypothetical protein